jgi:hypothetical protein
MRLWEEQEKKLQQIGEQLIESFNEKFPEFNAQLFEVENLFRNTWRAVCKPQFYACVLLPVYFHFDICYFLYKSRSYSEIQIAFCK